MPGRNLGSPQPRDAMGMMIVQLAGLMFAVSVVGLVVIVVTDNDTESLERLVGPLLMAVVTTGVVGGATKSTNERLRFMEERAARGDRYSAEHAVPDSLDGDTRTDPGRRADPGPMT